jgi:hypothetical protein
MANWYGKSRSNYFQVKDRAAFDALMELYEVEVIEKDGGVGFLARTEFGTIPTREAEEEGDDPISLADEIADHLAENQVCVIMEAGAEKLCYVSGFATAISWTGESVNISLDDIYKLAQDEFGGDAQITQAIY